MYGFLYLHGWRISVNRFSVTTYAYNPGLNILEGNSVGTVLYQI